MSVLENDIVVLLPRTLRSVRKRLLWKVPGPPVTQGNRGSLWALPEGTIQLFPEYALVTLPTGNIFADYMILPGHRVKDRKADLAIRENAWCCKAHLTGPYTDICTSHRLDAEALRLAGA